MKRFRSAALWLLFFAASAGAQEPYPGKPVRIVVGYSAGGGNDLIARGIFCSVKDLNRKIMRYIRSYNRKATPIKWSYKDASNRIKTALELNETVH